MDAFRLSPGITPLLTDAALVGFLLALGLGLIAGGQRGFRLGFLLAGVSVSVIKLVTDWADLPDDAVSIAALAASLEWGLLAVGRREPSVRSRTLLVVIGGGAVALGLLKVSSDFFDPFDLLVALSALVAGLGLLREGRSVGPFDAGANSEPPLRT